MGGILWRFRDMRDAISGLIGRYDQLGRYFDLGQSTSLVRADVRHATDSFKGAHLANDDIALSHSLGSYGNNNGEDRNERLWNDCHRGTNTVNKRFIIDIPGIGREYDDGEQDGKSKEQ